MENNNNVQENLFECIIRLYGLKKYQKMEELCSEVELVFSIESEKNLTQNLYFEYLEDIKNEIRYYDTIVTDEKKLNSNGNNNNNTTSNDMDIDIVNDSNLDSQNIFNNNSLLIKMDNILINLINEAKEQKSIEKALNSYQNPVYNLDFYTIFLIVLLINDKIDSARFLFKRINNSIKMNSTLQFLKNIIELFIKNNTSRAIEELSHFKIKSKEVEPRFSSGESDANDSDIDNDNENENNKSENITNNNKNKKNNSDENEEEEEEEKEEKEDKNSEQKKNKKKKTEENKNVNKNSNSNLNVNINININNNNEDVNKNENKNENENQEKGKGKDENESNKNQKVKTNNKFYFKIIQHSMLVEELIKCLIQKIRERQIQLIGKAYDKIQVRSTAQSLGLDDNNPKVLAEIVHLLVNEYGWKYENGKDGYNNNKNEYNGYLLPKSIVKEKKQETTLHQVNQLTSHLIYLEESDEVTKYM